MKPRLAALATAVPPFALDQDRVVERLRPLFAGSARFDRLLPVFVNSGIRRRYSAVPLDWFDAAHSWPERNRAYIAGALDLLETVAGRVLDRAEASLDEIGAVVVVSTTGIATPSLDALLIERMRLPRTVQRLPIFGLGCAGGAIGLGRAAALAASIPDKAVLFLVVELCTLAFHRDDDRKSDIVAAALFGDGAAGALVRCRGDGPAIVASGEHTWPDSLDVMGWDVAEDGLRAIFSRDIPTLVAEGLGLAASGFLARHGLELSEIDRFVCHPGGPKVIAACEVALGIPADSLSDARTVLREFGNMSAPSVLFVLERMLADGGDWRHALVTALGPGFTAGFTLLSRK
ncbi:MAG TPA: 3-oxoacyl-[acyl-carrier-protein] synthase III C-terminal domain-containing protein [Stellaceae bacterium]|jgi:alkylresorcinol/alkylpyrone synthase|nr:3-oxoacyl-[acyl-carrier-protein] synthase III C-terminal domain-containing protein [Stellaceae bacterium]